MLIHNVRELGLRIRDQRQSQGLSQMALAQRIGASRYWVMQVERGNSGAEIGLVLKALQALGLRLEIHGGAETEESLAPASRPVWPDLAAILERARQPYP